MRIVFHSIKVKNGSEAYRHFPDQPGNQIGTRAPGRFGFIVFGDCSILIQGCAVSKHIPFAKVFEGGIHHNPANPTLERSLVPEGAKPGKDPDKTFLKKVFGHGLIGCITKTYPEHFPGVTFVQTLLSLHVTLKTILQEQGFVHTKFRNIVRTGVN